MSGEEFAVDGIDHVELYVRDWDVATDWYERVLGLRPDDRFERWWETDQGPLVLSSDGSGASLALFERETATRDRSVSPSRVAFRTDADGFRSFLDRLDDLEMTDSAGVRVTRTDVVDHGLSYSLYFTDPDGNRLELTTNDYAAATAHIE